MSSGKAKDFFVSGASTPLTAVAAEPLSITESVAPAPPPKPSLAKASRKKILSQSDKKSLDDLRKEEIQSTDTGAKVTGVIPNNPPPDVEPEEIQEGLSRAHRPGSPAHSSKGSISSSISSSVKTQQTKSKPGFRRLEQVEQCNFKKPGSTAQGCAKGAWTMLEKTGNG